MTDKNFPSSQKQKEKEQLYQAARKVLEADPENYECYLLLAEYHQESEPGLAYLYLEQAAFCCADKKTAEEIRLRKNTLGKKAGCPPPNISIIIPVYNAYESFVECIQSIRDTLPPEAYEIIVVDNASTDERVRSFLESSPDIRFKKNGSNLGFAKACNQGADMASPGNALFFLNSDVILLPGSLLYMRIALLEENAGAVSCMTNYAGNGQIVWNPVSSIREAKALGARINLPNQDNIYEKKLFLVAFALLVSREAWEHVGGFDERYGLGYCEDNDLCLHLISLGYDCLLCHNSFCIHMGNASFGAEQKREQMERNAQVFENKWGITPQYAGEVREDAVRLIIEKNPDRIKVLEVGCGLGANLAYLRYRLPNAEIYGFEERRINLELGEKIGFQVIYGTYDKIDRIPINKGSLDYVILGDIPDEFGPLIKEKVRFYLKEDGEIRESDSYFRQEAKAEK